MLSLKRQLKSLKSAKEYVNECAVNVMDFMTQSPAEVNKLINFLEGVLDFCSKDEDVVAQCEINLTIIKKLLHFLKGADPDYEANRYLNSDNNFHKIEVDFRYIEECYVVSIDKLIAELKQSKKYMQKCDTEIQKFANNSSFSLEKLEKYLADTFITYQKDQMRLNENISNIDLIKDFLILTQTKSKKEVLTWLEQKVKFTTFEETNLYFVKDFYDNLDYAYYKTLNW